MIEPPDTLETRLIELVLVGEQDVVHAPELALLVRGQCGPSSQLGVRVHVGQRQVTEHVAQTVTKPGPQIGGDPGRFRAERALEVAGLDQR